MRSTVVYEKAPDNYAAYVPDPSRVHRHGATLDEVKANIRDAIAFHVEGLRIERLADPRSSGLG